MTTYAYNSLGAAIEIVDDEPLKIGETWNGLNVYSDEKVYKHQAYVRSLRGLTTTENLVFEDDIRQYVQTLEKADLLEIVSNVNIEDIIVASGMEEVKSPWK